MGTAIVITSGKGGTGKTSLTAGLSTCLAAMGRRVLCIDADVGLRNLDLTLGMSDQVLMDFTDVIEGRCTLTDAVVEHITVKNLFLLTAPVSAPSQEVTPEKMRSLVEGCRPDFDYILIDAPAGLGYGFQLAIAGGDRAIVAATTDATSLRDAQRTVSVLERRFDAIHLVVNRVRPKLLKKLKTTIDDAMDTAGLPLLGIVPEDELVTLAGCKGVPVITMEKRGAALAYYHMASRLEGKKVPLMKIR
jgi:septum site-determining protein MinD